MGRSYNDPSVERDCLCLTCNKWYHHKGIMRHRAMHRSRREYCEIAYSDGRVDRHHFHARKGATVTKEVKI